MFMHARLLCALINLILDFQKMLQWELRPFSTLCWSFDSIALVSMEKCVQAKGGKVKKKTKHIGDFLLVLIELFSVGITAEVIRAIIGSKSAISLLENWTKWSFI